MIYVVTMPGALGALKNKGSFIRPDVQAAAWDLHITTRFMNNENPTSPQARTFARKGDRRGRALLLCGKSMGGIKVTEYVLKRVWQEFGGYDKLAHYTVDAYGMGYGKGQVRGNLELPGDLVRNKDYFKAINLYQRSRGFEGALVHGAENHKLDRFPDGKKVDHMNIVEHPAIEEYAKVLLEWLVK